MTVHWKKAKMELEPKEREVLKYITDLGEVPEWVANDKRKELESIRKKLKLEPNHRVKGNFIKEWYWNIVEWWKVNILNRCPTCGSKTWMWSLEREYCSNPKCKYFKEQI